MPGGGDPERTWANARNWDGTVWFGDPGSPGGRTTLRACGSFGKPVYVLVDGLAEPPDVAAWIEAEEVRLLNVAGNRGSTEPGIGGRVVRFLVAVFGRLVERDRK